MKTILAFLVTVSCMSVGMSYPANIGGWTPSEAGPNGAINTDTNNVGGTHQNVLKIGGVHSSDGRALFHIGDKPITDIGGLTVPLNDQTSWDLPMYANANTDSGNVNGIHQSETRIGGVWQR